MFRKMFGLASLVGIVSFGSGVGCATTPAVNEDDPILPQKDSAAAQPGRDANDPTPSPDGSSAPADASPPRPDTSPPPSDASPPDASPPDASPLADAAPDAAPDAPLDAAPDAPRDAAPDAPRDAAVACYAPLNARVLPATFLPPTARRGVCTAAQVNAFYAGCLDPITSSVAACTAFVNPLSNAACLTCIDGSATSRLPPTLLPANVAGDRVFVNRPACAFLVVGRADCANNYSSHTMCLFSSCDTCVGDPATIACEDVASRGVCAPYGPTAGCDAALAAGAAAWNAACVGATFRDTYTKVTNYICGP